MEKNTKGMRIEENGKRSTMGYIILRIVLIILLISTAALWDALEGLREERYQTSLTEIYNALASEGWQKENVCGDIIVKNTSKEVWCRDSINNKGNGWLTDYGYTACVNWFEETHGNYMLTMGKECRTMLVIPHEENPLERTEMSENEFFNKTEGQSGPEVTYEELPVKAEEILIKTGEATGQPELYNGVLWCDNKDVSECFYYCLIWYESFAWRGFNIEGESSENDGDNDGIYGELHCCNSGD